MKPLTPRARAERGFAAFILGCSLLFLLLLHWQMFFGRIYVSGDTTGQNMPVRAFYQECLRRGDSFLWMPQLFCGFYVHGEGQGGLCHPEHWLLYRFLPLSVAITLESLLAYAFLYAGTFLMLRRFAFPTYAALFGAMSFAFGGFTLMHYAHMNGIEVISHIPWLIFAIDILLRTKDRRALAGAFLGVSLLKGSEFLMGYPFYAWCSFLAEALYALWVMATATGFRRAPLLLCAWAEGLLLGAIQLQPTRDMLRHSARSIVDFRFRMQFSSHPFNLVSLWSPFALKDQYFDTEFYANKCEVSLYNGVVCTLALFWCFLRYPKMRPEWRPLLRAAAVLAVVMLVFSFGYYGGVYRAVSYLPVFQSFRSPGRYILLAQLACSVFAAAAITDLFECALSKEVPSPGIGRRRDLLFFMPIALSILTFGVVVVAKEGPGSHRALAPLLGSAGEALCGVGLVLTATLLWLVATRRQLWALYALTVLSVLDMSWHWASIYARIIPTAPLSAYLREMPDTPDPGSGRLLTYALDDSRFMKHGYRLATGYAGLFPERVVPLWPIWQGPDYRPANDLPARRLAAVHWAEARDADGKPIGSKWEAVAGPLPRARLVTRAIISRDIPADLTRYDIARVALLNPDAPPLPLAAGGSPGTAAITDERPGRIAVDVFAPTRQLFVLSESWHPGWQITDDGQPASLLRVYGDYQGCIVPPGRHRLLFRFAPRSFETGKAGSLLGLLLAGASYLILRFSRVKRRAAPA